VGSLAIDGDVMRRINWFIRFGALLIGLSAIIYLIHYILFYNAIAILDNIVIQTAFLPFSVLIVTMVLDGMLARREKQEKIKKLNMVIGAFFSEVGIPLVRALADYCTGDEEVERMCATVGEWQSQDFIRLRKAVDEDRLQIDCFHGSMKPLRRLLVDKRDFLLGLLQNPNLLEHDSFTNLLWAVFHLTEELVNRKETMSLPASDRKHLAGDIYRAYTRLLSEWLLYMEHLRKDYPYLFSLAVRMNPFDKSASLIVT
jgi:hypothetical protein